MSCPSGSQQGRPSRGSPGSPWTPQTGEARDQRLHKAWFQGLWVSESLCNPWRPSPQGLNTRGPPRRHRSAQGDPPARCLPTEGPTQPGSCSRRGDTGPQGWSEEKPQDHSHPHGPTYCIIHSSRCGTPMAAVFNPWGPRLRGPQESASGHGGPSSTPPPPRPQPCPSGWLCGSPGRVQSSHQTDPVTQGETG